MTRGRPRGWRTTDPRCVSITIRLTAAEYAALKRRAKTSHRSYSDVLRAAIGAPTPTPRAMTKLRRLEQRVARLERRVDEHVNALVVTGPPIFDDADEAP